MEKGYSLLSNCLSRHFWPVLADLTGKRSVFNFRYPLSRFSNFRKSLSALVERAFTLRRLRLLSERKHRMQTHQLGNSDLHITRLGIGAWAIGGGGWNGSMGPQNDADSIPAIHAALDHGLNWIDTAALYGLGHSEEMIARALKGRTPRPYVFTKCERVWDAQGNIGASLKAESIRRECEGSLRRLQTDVIDLYQIHWPEPDEDMEEGWTELARLQKAGKVRYIGVSNFNVSQMKRAQAIAPITSLQPPYSIVTPEIEKEILPYAAQQNIGVIVYSPMSAGLLTGAMTRERAANLTSEDWRRNLPNFNEPLLSRNLRLVEQLREIGKRQGRTPGEVAIAWTLHNPAVTGAIVGFRNVKQVGGIIGATEFRLSSEEMGEIERALAQPSAMNLSVGS
jgi:aryl-alcohol dehydrogenase-like predicted oxidoreductase